MKSNKEKRKLFDNKAFRVVISVLASLLIWIYITGTQETEIYKKLDNVPVVFSGEDTMRESKGFVVTDVDTKSVSVEISGTRANIGKLGEGDIQAVIDLSKVTKTGNNRVSYNISYPDDVDTSAVTVISSSPESIQFYVAKMSTKTVPVEGAFVGSTAEGYIAEDPVFDPETIALTGPDSQLENIAYVWATIGGDNISKTKTADVTFTYMDEDGNELDYDDITPDYDMVTVTLPINVKKEIPLTVNLVEGAGATADNTIVTIEPSTITISGDSELVDGINSNVLATIDLTDFSSTFEETYPIVLDNNVQNVTGTAEATVQIRIVGLETKKFTVTNLSVTNVPDGYTAEMLTKSLDVTIRAAADVLDNIKSDNLRAVADLAGYASTGDVSVPVKIYVDGYSNAGAVTSGEDEYKVIVNIKR